MAQKRGCCEKLEVPLAEWVVRTWCSGSGRVLPTSTQLGAPTRCRHGEVVGDQGSSTAWVLGKPRVGSPCLCPACPPDCGKPYPSAPSLWLYLAMGKGLPCCFTHCGDKQPWEGMSELLKTGRCTRNKEMPGYATQPSFWWGESLPGV